MADTIEDSIRTGGTGGSRSVRAEPGEEQYLPAVSANDLRFQRAAVVARVKGDYSPLQVETLRFVQQRADEAYAQGQELLKAGRLNQD